MAWRVVRWTGRARLPRGRRAVLITPGAGSWLGDLSPVDLSGVKSRKQWVQLDGGLLPLSFTPKGEASEPSAWFATPTVAYAIELGCDLTPLEAYVRYDNGRYLDGWYTLDLTLWLWTRHHKGSTRDDGRQSGRLKAWAASLSRPVQQIGGDYDQTSYLVTGNCVCGSCTFNAGGISEGVGRL